MTLLNVLQYPDKRLREKAQAVDWVDDSIRQIVEDMFETMYEQVGVGLAATQVNIPYRIITIDVSEDKSSPLCLINPEIIFREGSQYEQEGCLSVPGVFDKVERSAKITFKALDQNGKSFEMAAETLLAICVQHEIDHLDGILFVDHLSSLKRERLKKKLEKVRSRSF